MPIEDILARLARASRSREATLHDQQSAQPAKEELPHAPPPIWAPDGDDLKTLPHELQRAVNEVVLPAYQQLVLAPRDPLEGMLGVTAAPVLWLESLQQVNLKQELRGELGVVAPVRTGQTDRL